MVAKVYELIWKIQNLIIEDKGEDIEVALNDNIEEAKKEFSEVAKQTINNDQEEELYVKGFEKLVDQIIGDWKDTLDMEDIALELKKIDTNETSFDSHLKDLLDFSLRLN